MTAEPSTVGREHWTHKGDVRLFLSEKAIDQAFVRSIKGAPHPNAAKALAEFMIGDAVQKLLPGEGIYAGRSDVEPPAGNPPLAQIKLVPIDYVQIEKDAKGLKTRFNEIYQ